MSTWRSLAILLVAGFFISFGATYSGDCADAQSDQALHIDIPMKLEMACSILATCCSTVICPFSSETWIYSASDLSSWNVKGEIIAVFHGDAAYLVRNDDSYNANRNIQTGHPVRTGNPYGKLLAGLMEQSIQIELCGVTAAANHWINRDLLSRVKVNTNALVRVTQLE